MQSGKTSSANLLVGEIMKRSGMIPEYRICQDGKLEVPVYENEVRWGVFDIDRWDYEFVSWCGYNLWPKVRVYNFANILKNICGQLYNIPMKDLYGSGGDKQKQTNCKLKNKKLSIREVLQEVGKTCRKLDDNCFINATINSIEAQGSDLSIVADCRYLNEIKAMKELGAKMIRLKREPYKSDHESETEMDELDDNFYDLVIPQDVCLEDKNQIILEYCETWGLL